MESLALLAPDKLRPCVVSSPIRNTGKEMQNLYSCSAVAEMGNRLATIDMGWKVGGCCAPFLGEEEGVGEDWKPKQLHGTSTDVEWSVTHVSLIITMEGKRWV